MINIIVHDDLDIEGKSIPIIVDIEGDKFCLVTSEQVIKMIEHILNKHEFSGERLCLEYLQSNGSYKTVDRWPR